MNRLTKRYNENIGRYEYVDAFSGAGIFDSIFKGITSKFVKDTATKLGTKALEAGVNKVGSEIGTRAANKVITTVDNKFFKPAPVKPLIKEIVENPLGNVIIKELIKKTIDDDNDDDDYNIKKQFYGYGAANSRHIPSGYGAANSRHIPSGYGDAQFQNKLNKLLK